MIACNLTWLRAPLLSEYPRYPGAFSKAFLPPQNAAFGDYTLCYARRRRNRNIMGRGLKGSSTDCTHHYRTAAKQTTAINATIRP